MSKVIDKMAVVVSQLKKSYGAVQAVNGISFNIHQGEIFGLLGPNGAGKSTTMEMIVGLRSRDSGEIKVLNYDPKDNMKKIKSKIGVQLQTVNLFAHLTVKEIITLFASFYKEPSKPEDVIKQVNLEEKSNHKVSKLSGGQQQRVAVAVAMVGNGEIIFLDEPTAGLDPQSRRSLWDVILTLKRMGKTVFITTHFMDEAEKLCDRVAIVDHGKIIEIDTPQQLITTHFEETGIEIFNKELANNSKIKELAGVTKTQLDGDNITLFTTEISETITELMTLAKLEGIQLKDMRVRQATLEDVFLKITGRRIRD